VLPPPVTEPFGLLPPPEVQPEWQREANHQQAMDTNDPTTTESTASTAGSFQKSNRRSGLLKKCMENIDAEYQKKAIKMSP
jgi:hypothetical protein